MIDGVAAHLGIANEQVVVLGFHGVDAQNGAQSISHHAHIVVESLLYVIVACDVGEHHIVAVGIYASATAFAAIELNAILLAIVDVHFVFNHLVAAENHCRLHLPHKEAIVVIDKCLSHILFHGKVEAKPVLLVVG